MNFSVRRHGATRAASPRASWRRWVVKTSLIASLGCLATAAPLASTSPGAATRPVEERLIGAWRLVSVQGNSPVRKVDYDHPTGFIVYDRSGWMSVQIAIHGERKPFAKGYSNGTVEEKAESFDTYFAYYGTYGVDAGAETVTHHIVDYTYPGMRGHDNVRWFELQGNNRLVLIPVEDGKGGRIARKDATYKLTWERIQ